MKVLGVHVNRVSCMPIVVEHGGIVMVLVISMEHVVNVEIGYLG